MKALRPFVLFVALAGVSLFAACGSAPDDGVPAAITPKILYVSLDQTVPVTVHLTKPRTAAGTLEITFDDPSVARVEPGAPTIEVPIGADVVRFTIQGKKVGDGTPGRTKIHAKIGDWWASAEVLVTSR